MKMLRHLQEPDHCVRFSRHAARRSPQQVHYPQDDSEQHAGEKEKGTSAHTPTAYCEIEFFGRRLIRSRVYVRHTNGDCSIEQTCNSYDQTKDCDTDWDKPFTHRAYLRMKAPQMLLIGQSDIDSDDSSITRASRCSTLFSRSASLLWLALLPDKRSASKSSLTSMRSK